MKISFYVQIFIVSILLLSCDTQTSVIKENTTIPMGNKIENKIVYLFFEIEKKADETEHIKHTDTKTAVGILKKGSIQNKENLPGNIAVTFLGKDGKIISEQIIEDPLNPMMETYSAEGLNREKLKFPKAEFSIRFNQTGEISSVKLEKITKISKNHLITIKL